MHHILYFSAMPTYETATTRHFYHGRTETVRSCTKEAIKFANALNDRQTYKPMVSLLSGALNVHYI